MQLKKLLTFNGEELILNLWQADPTINKLLIGSRKLAEAREKLFNYLNHLERHYFNIHSDKTFNEPGIREICIVTHFEHAYEITDEVIEAVSRIKQAGISIYNQQVFTYYNSFRFETAALRKTLKLAGIDPYYTFNTKGKEETLDFRVPIARIEQERKEEARFLPGIIRTDEPVFNVPILDYLKKMKKDGENLEDYRSIWYYF